MTALAASCPLVASPASGQISPGELAAAHAALEGSRHCLDCHAPRKGVDREGCLDCHIVLRDRIAAGRGLHADPAYAPCETCHIEHQGRDFALVWWGEDGRDAFDHADTGWPLEDAHRRPGCRACHRADRVAEPDELRAAGKDLDRTFLGLDPSCAACHRDPHGAQFAPDPCSSCHGTERFAPAAGFDHATTAFPLTGSHASVACADCHPGLPDSGPDAAPSAARRFRDLGRTACADCHADPHGGRLGSRCADCHTADDWRGSGREGFDHDRTGFPLRGRHRAVACASCHGPSFDRPRPPAAACADCHADPHLGQFARRPDGGACADCHDVDGWTPARFGREDHAATAFPLEGRHREVACRTCHAPAETDELARLLGISAPQSVDRAVRRFRFASTGCPECHADPHAGTATIAGDALGCGECHDLSGWTSVAFAHRRTGWPLAGGHRGVGCEECHRIAAQVPAPSRFDGLETACADCHRDPHRGQFGRLPDESDPAPVVVCERCHDDGRFRPVRFDHQVDSRFPLEGAHTGVACGSCHPRIAGGGEEIVLYRPLPRNCSDCHGDAPDPGGPG